MNLEVAVDIFRVALTQAMMIVIPILGTAISVGVLISLFQSVTSINDQTLTFVPKLLIVGGVSIALAPWVMRTLMEFSISIIQRIPEMSP